MKKLVIGIDGPASSGKSTIASILAKHFNILHLNTGSMYRAFAFYCKKNNVCFDNEADVVEVINKCDLNIKFENGIQQDYIDNILVTPFLRDEEIGKGSSVVSQYANVRKRAVEIQRYIAENMSVVMEGRDITSEVLPNADFKFFITATAEERANRRYKELIEKNIACDYSTILKEVKERDFRDTTRKNSPLKLVPDAIYIDTTNLNVQEVIEIIVNNIEKNEKNT